MRDSSAAVATRSAERPAEVARSSAAAGDRFLAILLLVSVAPFVAPLIAGRLGTSGALAVWLGGGAAIAVAVANAHVFATFYLLWDRAQLRGVEHPVFNLVVVPLGICAAILGLTIGFP